jgi:hypothetical protein
MLDEEFRELNSCSMPSSTSLIQESTSCSADPFPTHTGPRSLPSPRAIFADQVAERYLRIADPKMNSMANERKFRRQINLNRDWDDVLDALTSNKDDDYGDQERGKGWG